MGGGTKKKEDETRRKSRAGALMMKRGKLLRKSAARFSSSQRSPPLLRWKQSGERSAREVAFISKLSFKISAVPRVRGEGEFGGGQEGREGAGGTTLSKNKRTPPPKLDFNFRDIINFSRPRAPTACIIAEKKRIHTGRKEGTSRNYLETVLPDG